MRVTRWLAIVGLVAGTVGSATGDEAHHHHPHSHPAVVHDLGDVDVTPEVDPVWEAIHMAGAEFGIVNFGLLATESMRIEKNYPAWKSDLHTEFTVLEAGLDRFVNLDKPFQGRDAIVAQRDAGHRRVFTVLDVDNDVAAAHTGDPITAAGEIVGVVTSGAFGHFTGRNIAMGYVDPAHTAVGTELAVDVVGHRSTAIVTADPMFDPAHERPRAQ